MNTDSETTERDQGDFDNCAPCGARIFLAFEIDNHPVLLDWEPAPNGEIRICGAAKGDCPWALRNATTTPAGEPLPDLTTYRKHECPKGLR